MITATQLRELASIIGNLEFSELVDAGVLRRDPDGRPAVGGSSWSRFNGDLVSFILKLPDDRLEALATLANSRATTAKKLAIDNAATLLEILEDQRTQVGEVRDRIECFINEATGLKETCDRAYDSLTDARDALSELA